MQCYMLAASWLRWLLAGLSPQRPEFLPGSVHVGFVVHKVALGQVFLVSSSATSSMATNEPIIHPPGDM
jgi:hypothetical protein